MPWLGLSSMQKTRDPYIHQIIWESGRIGFYSTGDAERVANGLETLCTTFEEMAEKFRSDLQLDRGRSRDDERTV